MDTVGLLKHEALNGTDGATQRFEKLKQFGMILFAVSLCTTGFGLYLYSAQVDTLSVQMVNISDTNKLILAHERRIDVMEETNYNDLSGKIDDLSSQTMKNISGINEQILGMKQRNGTPNACQWVASKNGNIPPLAVQAGMDKKDNDKLFVARASYYGALIPGKVVPSHKNSYVVWGGRERPINKYEILSNCTPQWQTMSDGLIPKNALAAGHMENGTLLYVARAKIEDSLTPGWVQANEKFCHIGFDTVESKPSFFEVMVV